MDALQRTPLHSFHLAHGARMVPFAGWEMPVQYTSILEEHRSVRTSAGLFDVSHMGEVLVTGPDSISFLDQLLTNDISRLADGRVLYTMMCNEDGGVVDDLLVYRFSSERFMLVLNAGNLDKDLAWIAGQIGGHDCSFENVSPLYALLALQGPRALPVTAKLSHEVEGLKRHAFREATVGGVPAILSRTGYTGEDGVEIYLEAGRAEQLAAALLEAGREDGVRLTGLGARDSLRLEAGLPLYGHELSESITPLQAGLDWVVKLEKEAAFIGRDALADEKEAKPARKLLWFRLKGRRIARPGTAVLSGSEVLGEVLSGTLSPITGSPIGSALVRSDADPVSLTVDLRGGPETLEVARPPLHKTS